MAIFPGMEELSAHDVRQPVPRRQDSYDVVVLDCAPTAESLRFISLPTTLDWYMKHMFPMERRVLKAVRPIANRFAPVEVPSGQLFRRISASCSTRSRASTRCWRIRRSPACAW